MPRPLKDQRHERFCRERAGGQSLVAAWVAAGFPSESHNWWRFSQRRKIRERIEQIKLEFSAEAIRTRFLQERLMNIASANIMSFFDQEANGALTIKKNLADLPPELLVAISDLKTDANGVHLRLESKVRAIEVLLKTIPGALAPTSVDVSLSSLAEQLDSALRCETAPPVIDLTPQASPRPVDYKELTKLEVGMEF